MHPPLAQAACTLRMHCIVSQAWPGRVAAHVGPCRSAVSLCALVRCCASYRRPPRPCRALYRDTTPCRRPLPVTIQNLYCDLAPAARALRDVSLAHCASCRALCRGCRSPQRRIVAHCCVVSQPWLHSIVTQRSPLSHDTMFCIATHPGQVMRACAAACLARRQAVSWPVS